MLKLLTLLTILKFLLGIISFFSWYITLRSFDTPIKRVLIIPSITIDAQSQLSSFSCNILRVADVSLFNVGCSRLSIFSSLRASSASPFAHWSNTIWLSPLLVPEFLHDKHSPLPPLPSPYRALANMNCKFALISMHKYQLGYYLSR